MAAPAGRQLRLLLWKDYLIRKRNFVTLGGIVWATAIVMGFYVVRINIDNQDFPSCQYSARALPSAGLLTFVQSFVCSVDNQCNPMDQFQEIPSYENSRLSRVRSSLGLVLANGSVLEVAGSVPGALKLLATLARVLDEPTLVHIAENGLKVQDLFVSPRRVRRLVSADLNVSAPLAAALLRAPLNIQGLMKPSFDRCNASSVSNLISMESEGDLETLTSRLCALTDEEARMMATALMLEVDYDKYISMAGEMYHKLSGDGRLSTLAGLARAVLRFTNADSYLPPVFAAIFENRQFHKLSGYGRFITLAGLARAILRFTNADSYLPPVFAAIFENRQVDFSYFNITVITKLMDEFEPTFGKTKAYQILRDITDTVATGLQYLDRIYAVEIPVKGAADLMLKEIGNKIDDEMEKQNITSALNNAFDVFEKAMANEPIDVFKILSQVTNFIIKFLPDKTQHDVQFYSTLLAKLIEGANKVVSINWDIQAMAYDVSLRNPAGVAALRGLPLHVVRKGLEGLADAERVQILSSKVNVRGQIFCDANRMAGFFKISKKEADSLKVQLCTDGWKDYVGDMIKSFGIYDVRDLINNMASLVIQETIGKDTSDLLYSIEKDFQILKDFTDSLNRAKSKNESVLEWGKLFNVSDDSELMKVFSQNAYLGKQILITVHGGLAKEVVKQNTILEYKLSPLLLDLTTVVRAINAQLQLAPARALRNMKTMYPDVVQVLLDTVLNEDKTYLALSTPSTPMVCAGAENAAKYLELSTAGDKDALVATLCDVSKTIDEGLRNDSVIAKAIATIRNTTHGPLEEVNWTHLISGLKDLYVKLDTDYPYLFELTAYGMDRVQTQAVEEKMKEANNYWFSTKNIERGMHLSVKLLFRLLDLIDRPAFGVQTAGWLQGKAYVAAAAPPLRVAHALFVLITGAPRNESVTVELPAPAAAALGVLSAAAPHLLRDTADIVLSGTTDVAPLISLINSPGAWPCGPSVADVLPLSPPSKAAVKAAETLMCVDDDAQDQWDRFVKDNDLKLFNVSAWNTTSFQPHLFLKFSRTFDALVGDVKLAKDLLQDLISSKSGERMTLADAWNYAAEVFQRADRNETMKSLLANVDAILNSVSSPIANASLSEVWAQLANCSSLSRDCRDTWRAVWKRSLQAASVILEGIAADLLTYFTEINEPDATLIQLLGFTRRTGLFVLYERLPEFVGALLNSFWDYGFMTQVRRASGTQFWECEAVLGSLVLPAAGHLDRAHVELVKPVVCPSLLYWISMPRGANTFLDIVSKPQYTIYNMDVQNLTSSYESAFTKATALALLLKNMSNKNDSLKKEDTSLSSLENKLKETVNIVLSYRINETNPSYRLFHEINKKQFISAAYLTRITAMVNKLALAIENLNPMSIKTEINDEEVKKSTTELATVSKIFKRRPQEAIALHFDVITDMLERNSDSYSLVNALETACNDLKNNDTSKDIVSESQRTKNQICGKDYKAIYGAVQHVIADDLESARNSLVNMISMLQDGDDNSTDVIKFFKDRKKLVNSLRISVKHAYDLGLPVYLKYLQSNLQSYEVVLSFLSGGEWWSELRRVYAGPNMDVFYEAVEKSCDIAVDVLTQLDKIQIVRLLRDIELNNTSSFCLPNVSLSDYIPDGTGLLSRLKLSACSTDNAVFKEIPPLVFASQGFDEDLTLSKDIDYASLNSDISEVESRLAAVRDGPHEPRRPAWVTDESLAKVKEAALGLVKGEALTKAAFGLIGNIVDAGTLFLNNSQCSLCSQVTTWVKQINLQLYKKQEYHALLCRLETVSPGDLHRTLKEDFHWDMAFKELISSRNYTKLELNKSLGELLELVKLQVLDEVGAPPRCHAALNQTQGHKILTMIADTITLFRAELPYLHEVEGMKEVPFMKELLAQVAPSMDVYAPLKKYLNRDVGLSKQLSGVVDDNALVEDIEKSDVNLRLVGKNLQQRDVAKFMKLRKYVWSEECKKYNCQQIVDVINQNMNTTLVIKELPNLQSTEFWKLSFISDVLAHVARALRHAARLAAAADRMDIAGAGEGKLAPTIDLLMELLTEDTLNDVVQGIQGILEEAAPILNDTSIAGDLRALTNGLQVLQQYKSYLIKEDIKIPVGAVWSDWASLERALQAAGFDDAHLWGSMRTGHIALTPILSWKSGDHISSFVCRVEEMSRVILPGQGPPSREEVLQSLVEQFCGLSDSRVNQLVPLLLQGMNYTYILDKVTTVLLSQLYTASNLTQAEGEQISAALPRMATVLPSIQAPVGDVAKTLAEDPLMQTLKNFSSIGGLLESGDFMTAAGNMVCGRPFSAGVGVARAYRAVLQNKDNADQPDEKQLATLPTEYCRSLYVSLTAAAGGKVVWSFLKPLLLGKLLYAPPAPHVLAIIKQANTTFEFMANLTELVHSFAGAFSSVEQLSDHRQGVTVLRNLLSSAAFEELRTSLVGEGELPDVNIEDMFDEFGDLQDVGGILRQASSLLRCISLDRFRAAPDERALEHRAAALAATDEFSAGLVFLNNETDGNPITNIQYKIRMDIDNTPTTARLKNYLWIPGPEDSFLENMRYFRGFVQIQDMIDRAIIDVAKQGRDARVKREVHNEGARVKGEVGDDKWAVYTQQMPYPCYRKDFFQTSLYESQALIVAFLFSLLFTVASAVRFLVADTDSGNTGLMSVMGVRPSTYTLSWALCSFLELLLTYTSVMVVLRAGGVLPRADVALLAALLAPAAISVLAFCYLLTKVLRRSSVAAVCAAVAYLLTFMPVVIIISLEAVISKAAKLLVCLSMSSALCYAFVNVGRYEASGGGAKWAHLWDAPTSGDVSMGLAAVMMLLDAAIYFAIGYTIDHFFDIQFTSLPPAASPAPTRGVVSMGLAALMMLLDAAIYFAIGYTIDHFFGIKTQSCITSCDTSEDKAGVSIVNVSKEYGKRLVLDNVSIELQRGHITTLLGHNGAGKTTLINILTGMLKPTRGHVAMRAAGGGGVGVCPQRDVLYPHLTPREHIALYAELKGVPKDKVNEEVESMLSVLSLGAVADAEARRLSGGTRRRLCVGLAFVGRVQLVLLDEPTAGVDPNARRAIWSLIVRLRGSRAVLLTTHHLQEAELLSDHLVILHQGQVHTTGSPIEIKRTLGHGYRLSVTYPDRTWEEDEGLEERTKELLATTREVVTNASIASTAGLETEITLPFYDNNGVSNDFLRLCCTLEERQSALGFSSYALDCSSLEHVLHQICQQGYSHAEPEELNEAPYKSTCSSSTRTDSAPLVCRGGPLAGSAAEQCRALLRARYLHYSRNWWALSVAVVVPALFVLAALGFSCIRPPPDNEAPLHLARALYNATDFLTPYPSISSKHGNPAFAESVMRILMHDRDTRNWTEKDTPVCECGETRQICHFNNVSLPRTMVLPDVATLNDWLVKTQELYIEKRYGGFTSAIANNKTNFVAWYNNKGHHALPAFLSALNSALLKQVAGNPDASITTYSHPLKISKEQLSKDTVYQHIADAGISGLVLVAYCLVAGSGCVYLVAGRAAQEKRLALLSGVPPAVYWAAAMGADMLVIVINMVLTAILMEAFQFPVFVARNNLPAICLLILVYGFAGSALSHVAEKLFSDASVASMLMFCGNAFLGLGGLTVLLILDLISQSEATDNARWVLHKIFMLAPPFALGDGLLEISKNTIQAQVLSRFGMDTYRDPLRSWLVAPHALYMAAVGGALVLLNHALEYRCLDSLVHRFTSESPPESDGEMEDLEVTAERRKVLEAISERETPLRLHTIGNINAGFVDTEGKKSLGTVSARSVSGAGAWCVRLGKRYVTRRRPALWDLTLSIPPAQCTALLGENGAGKSTTFSLLTGQLRPTTGTVYLQGEPVTRTELCRGNISYCPQNDALDPLLTARETLSIYCQLRGIHDQHEVIKRTMDLFELTRYGDTRAGALSGGNRRKLCTALAFMSRATLVLLDEPTSGMDPVSRECVARGVRRACGERRAVLLSTHQVHDARRLAATVALLRRGRLRALAPTSDCLARFGGGYVVECRVGPGGARAAWRAVRQLAPTARLQLLHHAALHFLLPLKTTAGSTEEQLRVSDIFRVLARLQAACDVHDYSVSQSSLDQMFISFGDGASIEGDDAVELEPLPEHLASVTAL